MLSYEKTHSKSIIGMPKIIQLCDGIMASGLQPVSHGTVHLFYTQSLPLNDLTFFQAKIIKFLKHCQIMTTIFRRELTQFLTQFIQYSPFKIWL